VSQVLLHHIDAISKTAVYLCTRARPTRKKLQITLRGEFQAVVERIMERKKSHRIRSVALIGRGSDGSGQGTISSAD
jgi:hypothetical protein